MFRAILIFSVVFFGFFSALHAFRIGIVDSKKVMTEVLAVKELQAQIQAKQEQYQAQIRAKEAPFKKLREDPQRRIDARRQKELREGASIIKEMVRTMREELSNEYRHAMDDFQAKMDEVIARIATDLKLDMVMAQEHMIWICKDNPSTVVITERIVEILNREYPVIKILHQ